MNQSTLKPGYRITPDGAVLVPLRGKRGADRHAKIDHDDYAEVSSWRWYVNHHGYAYGQRQGPRRVRMQVFLHHLVFETPDGAIVDHVNGDRLDARKANLRIATYSVNNRNRRRVGKRPFKGVAKSWGGRWQARIKWRGQNWNLGAYSAPEDAARVYDAAALYIDPDLGDHAVNFPGEVAPMHPVAIRREAAESGNLKAKSSPYLGVHWKARNAAFQAFCVDGQATVYLGLHDDEEQAARAHDAYALHTRGANARTNFADGQPRSREEILAAAVAIRADRPAKRRTSTTNRSGFQGVKFHPKNARKRWQAMISLAGSRRSLGYFFTPEGAARAYDAACAEAGLEPVNFP